MRPVICSPVFASVVIVLIMSCRVSTWADDIPQISAPERNALEEMTIIGTREDVIESTGSAHVLDSEHLRQFEYADVQRILRDVPGVSVQLEDGYGLRPNLSIRGTATERSGRITLLEDNVLIAPAPYSAPSAYYFPTVGRMSQVEVLKGSSAIKQGPYTVGGAINLVSTPIPQQREGGLNVEVGSHETTRLHATYGDSQTHYGWLIESHLWDSNGFQNIDIVNGDTGLNKDDWTAKFRINSDPNAAFYQQLEIKLQYAKENSEQSYLGLTDKDFRANPYRRYAASQLDNIDTKHEQIIVRYLANVTDQINFTATIYSNNHKRDWFKTEGFDADGSVTANDFLSSSWFQVVDAVNNDRGIDGLSASALQSVLDGGDTAVGALQLRNNAREYFSRGVQFGLKWDKQLGQTTHKLELGVRYHQDEEDRLQRNSTYTQAGGELLLVDSGVSGNAGNRVQEARATSFHVYDQIKFKQWIFTPGVRYEDIYQQRTRWETRSDRTANPASRSAENVRDYRENHTRVWLPGVGVHYSFNDHVALYGGMHRGFTAPSNAPDVDEEKSVNYELGLRLNAAQLALDAAVFYTDYDNILGECTSSSGSDCDIGSAFNGDAASIAGLELQINYDLSPSSVYALPASLSYTYLDGEFDTDIADTDFFGDVQKGDPLPYIPKHQMLLSLGYEYARWSGYVRANYVDQVCVRASCSNFEATDSFLVLDASMHYQISPGLALYTKIDNLTSESAIVGRQPYGARPVKERGYSLGMRFSF